jgi:hypothetical protein
LEDSQVNIGQVILEMVQAQLWGNVEARIVTGNHGTRLTASDQYFGPLTISWEPWQPSLFSEIPREELEPKPKRRRDALIA